MMKRNKKERKKDRYKEGNINKRQKKIKTD